ncbi:MAG: hypothetical protein JWQ32_610 [Marmoricola sp.]|nr:hypothetical protein [Marmoricola sp.]
MAEIHALPASGDVFGDARDQGRAMRLSWHGGGQLAVLSIWRAGTCVASFQLARNDVPGFVESLVRTLSDEEPEWTTRPNQAS